jgi:hypothetical protein
MKFIDKFIRTVQVALHRSGTTEHDADAFRQNSPPDESEAESYETEAELVLVGHAGPGSSSAEEKGKAKATRAGGRQ